MQGAEFFGHDVDPVPFTYPPLGIVQPNSTSHYTVTVTAEAETCRNVRRGLVRYTWTRKQPSANELTAEYRPSHSNTNSKQCTAHNLERLALVLAKTLPIQI
jgi:hypothetical protein